MLREIDDWVIGIFECVVTFLNDWLFLSQHRLEKLVMALFASASIINYHYSSNASWVTLLVDFLLLISFWVGHNRTQRERVVRRLTHMGGRMLFTGLCLLLMLPSLLFLVTFKETKLYAITSILWLFLVYCMEYLTVLGVDGECGRKAKLSLEKLTELFGKGWDTTPVGSSA